MKHLRKPLAILLALLMLLSIAPASLAAPQQPEPPQKQAPNTVPYYKLHPEALQDEAATLGPAPQAEGEPTTQALRPVTGIAAALKPGTQPISYTENLDGFPNPSGYVTVTLSFGDGGWDQEQTAWYGEEYGGGPYTWWQIFYNITGTTATSTNITIYYEDSAINRAFWETHYEEDLSDEEWDALDAAYKASLLSVALEVPVTKKTLTQLLAELAPATALALGQTATANVPAAGYQLFTFIPAKTQSYYVTMDFDENALWPYLRVLDPANEFVGWHNGWWNSNKLVREYELQAGKTYQILAAVDGRAAGSYDITINDSFDDPNDSWLAEEIQRLLPGTPLTLDVPANVVIPAASNFKLFTFTPTETGYYKFSTGPVGGDGAGLYWGNAYLGKPDYSYLNGSWFSFEQWLDLSAHLEAGKTYYLLLEIDADSVDFPVKVEKSNPEFKLSKTTYKIRYKAIDWISPWDFIQVNTYEGVKVNGIPLDEYEEERFYCNKPGVLKTYVYTDAEGKQLGTVEIKCSMSLLQTFVYYVLFGWLWLPGLYNPGNNYPSIWDSLFGGNFQNFFKQIFAILFNIGAILWMGF